MAAATPSRKRRATTDSSNSGKSADAIVSSVPASSRRAAEGRRSDRSVIADVAVSNFAIAVSKRRTRTSLVSLVAVVGIASAI